MYGVKSRYSYHQRIPTDLQTLAFEGLVKYDHETGLREVYDYDAGWHPSEAPFAKSANGTDEDSGYVVTIATNGLDYRSEAWVFDAKNITSGPIARVEIPTRVASGFHAMWAPGRDLWGEGPAPL